MRILRFIVDGNRITQDPTCDFTGLFPGKTKQVKSSFEFSPEWTGSVKVLEFVSMLGNEYPPQVIDSDGSCMIPDEALAFPAFKMKVLGATGGSLLETETITIYLKGGGV